MRLLSLGPGRRGPARAGSGARVGDGEIAVWQAAARARTVVVRHLDDSASTSRRGDAEETATFAARIATPARDDHEATPALGPLAAGTGGHQ